MKKRYVPLLLIPLLLSGCNYTGGLAFKEIVTQISQTISSPEDVLQYLNNDPIETNNATFEGKAYFQMQNSDEYNHLDEPFTGQREVEVVQYEDTEDYKPLRLLSIEAETTTDDEGKEQTEYTIIEHDNISEGNFALGIEVPNSVHGYNFLTGVDTNTYLTASREIENACTFAIKESENNPGYYTIQINDEDSDDNQAYLGLNISGISYIPQYLEEEYLWQYLPQANTFVSIIENEHGEEITIYVYGRVGSPRQIYAMNAVYKTNSILTRVPLHLDRNNFYIEDNGRLDSNCQYYSIRTSLVSTNTGYDYELRIGRTDEGHIIFYAPQSNLSRLVYGVIGVDTYVTISGKADVALEYDENGYLIRECYISLEYYKSGQVAFGDYTYTYNA